MCVQIFHALLYIIRYKTLSRHGVLDECFLRVFLPVSLDGGSAFKRLSLGS